MGISLGKGGKVITKLEPWYRLGDYWGYKYPEPYNCWYRKIVKIGGNRIDWIRVDPHFIPANSDYYQHFSQYGTLVEFVQRPWGNHLGWLILEGWPIGDDGPNWWIS